MAYINFLYQHFMTYHRSKRIMYRALILEIKKDFVSMTSLIYVPNKLYLSWH